MPIEIPVLNAREFGLKSYDNIDFAPKYESLSAKPERLLMIFPDNRLKAGKIRKKRGAG